MDIPNIGTAKAKCLYDAGFKNLADIKNSSIDELSKIKGISKNFAKEIIEYLKNH
jgi:excinuclease UvrABC nuclease subunit